jgi:hypothetical protein
VSKFHKEARQITEKVRKKISIGEKHNVQFCGKGVTMNSKIRQRYFSGS